MTNLTYLCLLISLAFHYSCGQREKKFFRKDYHFIESENSFYKIHVLPLAWQEAKQMCEWEGATLFYADSEEEYTTVLSYLNETQGMPDIWLGISSLLVKGVFVTINGTLMMDVYNKWYKQEPNNVGDVEDCVVARTSNSGVMNDENCVKKRPYICKKILTSLAWQYSCNMPYTDYVYKETLGKCYKFHYSPKNWTDAYTICSSELSYLAVIDNQDELDYIKKDLENYEQNKIVRNCYKGTGFVGYHNRLGNGWRTIKDVSLEDDDQIDFWGVNQPDGGIIEKCGALMNGKLHDFPCDHRCYFVCEHDIQQSMDFIITKTY